MRIVFMGSAEPSVPSLEALAGSGADDVVGVVTQPDRPKGRRLRVEAGPVRAAAEKAGLRVFAPERVNLPGAVAELRALAFDVLVVVAYGQILKSELLGLPPLGCINVHASLLPKYRGAAPVQWAIANGETVTGATTMFMNERLDAGDILLQKPVAILAEDTGGTLQDRLGREGAGLLVETLSRLRAGRLQRAVQVEAGATYAPRLRKDDGRMDWTRPAAEIANRVRGFNPWPCCFCEPAAPAGARPGFLRVLKARAEAARAAAPGELLAANGGGPLVAAGEGAVRLLLVQPEGRGVMSGADYQRGRRMAAGAAFR